tara:strand:+ start:311 stop:427 length:117 start_codon:yes stop_codon:yes gene_type:complete
MRKDYKKIDRQKKIRMISARNAREGHPDDEFAGPDEPI